MQLKPFSQIIEPEKAFEMQKYQYQERLLMQVTVPAGSTAMGQVAVSNLGHFMCVFITGTFTTLASPAGVVVDSGVSYLSGQLIDGAGQRKLFNDRIPLDLILSPGRRKDAASTGVLTDPVSNSLFYPIELNYIFTANSMIQMDIANASDEPNTVEICFHGIRIISQLTSQGRSTVAPMPASPAAGQRTRYIKRG